MPRAYRLQRLWHDGVISPIWTGYSLVNLWRFISSPDWSGDTRRVWIEREDQPATRDRA
jgi:hypothetical protein